MREAVERLEVPRVDGRGSLRLQASFGVAALPESAVDREGLIAAADAALYRAKRAGRNRVERAEPVRRPAERSGGRGLDVLRASIGFRAMGVLDDAIREHLDLKRRHGVAEDELRRQEEEALGPARREVAPADSDDGERRPARQRRSRAAEASADGGGPRRTRRVEEDAELHVPTRPEPEALAEEPSCRRAAPPNPRTTRKSSPPSRPRSGASRRVERSRGGDSERSDEEPFDDDAPRGRRA